MAQRYYLGRIGKLNITAGPSAGVGFLILWPLFSLLGLKAFRLRPGMALAGGFLATMLHFASELLHQLGHARAAERTGYPMEGVHLWGVLGSSVYPADEPELAPEIHVERALGGPRVSALLAAGGGVAALMTHRSGKLGFMVSSLFALENLTVFTLGALLPLPFIETDGTILQRYRGAHRKRMVVIQE